MFAKIFAQIFDSSLAEDYLARLVFEDMLILCDSEGIVDMTHEAISRRTNVPIEVVKSAIEKLEGPDRQSRTPDHEGRRILRLDAHRNWGWKVVNYMRFRETRDENGRREYRRNWMSAQRDIDPQYGRNTEKNGTGEHGEQMVNGGEPKKKEKQKKIGEDKSSPSQKGLSFAKWFKSLLPASVRLSSNWQTQWAVIYDELIRLDKRTVPQIRDVCTWARQDDFWSSNFLSPAKLRQRDKNKVLYFDVFMAKIEKQKLTGAPSEELKQF